MPPLLYDVPSAQAATNMSRGRLYEHIKAGRLHIVKLGSRTYITPEELERFVKRLVKDAESLATEEAG